MGQEQPGADANGVFDDSGWGDDARDGGDETSAQLQGEGRKDARPLVRKGISGLTRMDWDRLRESLSNVPGMNPALERVREKDMLADLVGSGELHKLLLAWKRLDVLARMLERNGAGKLSSHKLAHHYRAWCRDTGTEPAECFVTFPAGSLSPDAVDALLDGAAR